MTTDYFFLTCDSPNWPDHPMILWLTTNPGGAEPTIGGLEQWHANLYKFISNRAMSLGIDKGEDYGL